MARPRAPRRDCEAEGHDARGGPGGRRPLVGAQAFSELGVKKEERDGQIMWTRTEEAYE
jgi:hypothetical protein